MQSDGTFLLPRIGEASSGRDPVDAEYREITHRDILRMLDRSVSI